MDRSSIPLRAELRDTLKLAAPIVLNQVGHMSMGLVDTVVAGRISTTTIGGLGLAANVFWTFTSCCLGCLFALDTYFSQSLGAKDNAALSKYLRQSWWACAFVTIASALCIVIGAAVYALAAAPGPVKDAFFAYLEKIIWCLPTLFAFFVLQRYWQARHRVLPFTVIILGANVLNLFACLAFGLGLWGFPRLEVKGIAIATVICRYLMLVGAIVFTWYELRPSSWTLPRVDWRVQRQLFRLGLPAAGHTALEIGAFTIATFVASALGAVPLAAHHVCLMMAAFTFMFPYGFSQAAAVRVGTFIGAEQAIRARTAGYLCIGVSVACMTCFALGYWFFPRTLLGWFTHDPAVIETGATLLVFVAVFQVADGTQVSATGALRGLGNTRAAMVANLIGHYPVGLALGLVLCFGFKLGVSGLWAGLAAGLISVGAMLLYAWYQLTRDVRTLRPLARVEADH
jgi:MATE family multidrug resistance protein